MRLKLCEICKSNTGTKSSIVGDIYYKYLCDSCYQKMMVMENSSSGEAAYDRDRDFEDHEADMRQPYNDGKPDKEFIKLYPETARKMFNDDEITQAERS